MKDNLYEPDLMFGLDLTGSMYSVCCGSSKICENVLGNAHMSDNVPHTDNP